MSLLILVIGNERHLAFKTRKDEMYVQGPPDFILNQVETARRNKKFKIHPYPHNPYKTIFIFVSFFICIYLNTEYLSCYNIQTPNFVLCFLFISIVIILSST